VGDAFAEQVLELRPYLGRLAHHLTDRREDGEDLVQDTIERALRYRQLFDGRNLKAWLGVILRNQAMTQRRRNHLRRADALEWHPELLARADVERQAIANLELEQVVRRWPQLVQELFRLQPHDNSSRSRLRRARRRARNLSA
jgi:RNA polymerase sigma-70 factor (ECF subfamily)